jgi:polysaccharide export outer membrane protein
MMIGRFLAMLPVLWALLPVGSVFAADTDVYQLRAGDAVLVSVWKEDALQKEVRVLPDGSITFPLVGRVEVGGLSTPEVEQRIAARLKQYIPEPTVSVVITGIEGNRAFVIGKVLKPGPMTMTGPTTVLQALSMAGGLDKFANEGAIKVIRTRASVQEIMAVNYKDLINGNSMSTNYQLKVGDTVLVP